MPSLPSTVKEGMDVYDADNNHIGKVESFNFGNQDPAQDAEPITADGASPDRDSTLLDNFADALWPDDMPEALRARLSREGYVVLDADGILHKDRYIFPDQIASATADGLVLSVRRDDLVKT